MPLTLASNSSGSSPRSPRGRNSTFSQGSQRSTVRSTAWPTSSGTVITVSSSLSCSIVGL